MKSFLITLISFMFVIACKKNEHKPLSETQKILKADSDIQQYKDILSEAISDSENNHQMIPIGRVTFSKQGITNPENNIFPWNDGKSIEFIRELESKGLVTLKEVDQVAEHNQQQSGKVIPSILITNGEVIFNINPTPKAYKIENKRLKKNNSLYIQLGMASVESVIKEEKYINPNTPQSDDYILSVGTYTYLPTNNVGISSGHGRYKFRAILHFNPFTKKYSVITFDWGEIDSPEWKSNNVN